MKRTVSLLLTLLLALTLCTAVRADTDSFVFDYTGSINAEDLEILRQRGAQILSDTGAAVCICITNENPADINSFAREFYNGHIGAENGILLVHARSEENNIITYYATGELFSTFTEEDMMRVVDAYNAATTYYQGVYDYMSLVEARLGGVDATGVVTPEDNPNIPTDRKYDRVVDFAGVIDAQRLSGLIEKADAVSEKYECDVAVAFVQSLGGKYVVDYADDFYDYNGYGYGQGDDGILLLISVGDREYATTTYGYGITAFTDYGIEKYLEPNFFEYLRESDWAGAADAFISGAEYLLEQARSGQVVDVHEYDPPQYEQKTVKVTPLAAAISAVLGFFTGGIPTASMKRQLKSVQKNYGAANYVAGGLNLRRRDDIFLYTNVSKTPIPHDTNSSGGRSSFSGGSSVHFSSSGRSHGGSHGKF